jgi:hypothetical protein
VEFALHQSELESAAHLSRTLTKVNEKSEGKQIFSFPGILQFFWNKLLTVYHFRGHDSLSLAVFNGIVLWGATEQTGTGNRVPLALPAYEKSGNIHVAQNRKYSCCLDIEQTRLDFLLKRA